MVYPTGTLTATQAFSGSGGAYYDPVVGRWLPVPREAVSPDGLAFAYADYDLPPPPAAGMAGAGRPHGAGVLATTGRLYLVDATTGGVSVLYSGSPTYAVAGFTSDGIYLSQVAITMDGNFKSGLWLISTSGGTPVPVPGGDRKLDRGGWSIEGGLAWGTEYSTGGGLPAGNQLVALDLHTGVVTTWLTAPEGTALGFLGFDATGNALVFAGPSGYSGTGSPAPTPPWQLIALTGPQQAQVVWQTTDGNAFFPFGPVFDDARGAWIGGQGGVVWLDAGGVISKTALAIDDLVRVGNGCLVS